VLSLCSPARAKISAKILSVTLYASVQLLKRISLVKLSFFPVKVLYNYGKELHHSHILALNTQPSRTDKSKPNKTKKEM
jgi:hypothetical protein